MSKSYDKRPQIRLEPETLKAIAKQTKNMKVKPSLPKIVNGATRLGLAALFAK
jgi:hypothetical protein